jgi:hypothetical protein
VRCSAGTRSCPRGTPFILVSVQNHRLPYNEEGREKTTVREASSGVHKILGCWMRSVLSQIPIS